MGLARLSLCLLVVAALVACIHASSCPTPSEVQHGLSLMVGRHRCLDKRVGTLNATAIGGSVPGCQCPHLCLQYGWDGVLRESLACVSYRGRKTMYNLACGKDLSMYSDPKILTQETPTTTATTSKTTSSRAGYDTISETALSGGATWVRPFAQGPAEDYLLEVQPTVQPDDCGSVRWTLTSDVPVYFLVYENAFNDAAPLENLLDFVVIPGGGTGNPVDYQSVWKAGRPYIMVLTNVVPRPSGSTANILVNVAGTAQGVPLTLITKKKRNGKKKKNITWNSTTSTNTLWAEALLNIGSATCSATLSQDTNGIALAGSAEAINHSSVSSFSGTTTVPTVNARNIGSTTLDTPAVAVTTSGLKVDSVEARSVTSPATRVISTLRSCSPVKKGALLRNDGMDTCQAVPGTAGCNNPPVSGTVQVNAPITTDLGRTPSKLNPNPDILSDKRVIQWNFAPNTVSLPGDSVILPSLISDEFDPEDWRLSITNTDKVHRVQLPGGSWALRFDPDIAGCTSVDAPPQPHLCNNPDMVVRLSGPGTLRPGNRVGSITMGAWVKIDPASPVDRTFRIMSRARGHAAADHAYMLSLEHNGDGGWRPRVRVKRDNGQVITVQNEEDVNMLSDRWYHVVATARTLSDSNNAIRVRLYVDGCMVQESISSSAGPIWDETDGDYIFLLGSNQRTGGPTGNRIGYQPFSGLMDDAFIVIGELSPGEVRSYHQGTRDRHLGHWTNFEAITFDLRNNGLPTLEGGVSPAAGAFNLNDVGNRASFDPSPAYGLRGVRFAPDNDDLDIESSIRVGSGILPDDFTRAFTVSGWFRIAGNAPYKQMRIISRAAEGGEQDHVYMLSLLTKGGGPQWYPRFRLKTGTDFTAGTVTAVQTNGPGIDRSTWYHIAGVFDGSYAKVYLDGVLIHSKATNGEPVFNDADAGSRGALQTLIGANPSLGGGSNWGNGYTPFNGHIDRVRIIKGALTDCQMAELAQRERNERFVGYMDTAVVQPNNLVLRQQAAAPQQPQQPQQQQKQHQAPDHVIAAARRAVAQQKDAAGTSTSTSTSTDQGSLLSVSVAAPEQHQQAAKTSPLHTVAVAYLDYRSHSPGFGDEDDLARITVYLDVFNFNPGASSLTRSKHEEVASYDGRLQAPTVLSLASNKFAVFHSNAEGDGLLSVVQFVPGPFYLVEEAVWYKANDYAKAPLVEGLWIKENQVSGSWMTLRCATDPQAAQGRPSNPVRDVLPPHHTVTSWPGSPHKQQANQRALDAAAAAADAPACNTPAERQAWAADLTAKLEACGQADAKCVERACATVHPHDQHACRSRNARAKAERVPLVYYEFAVVHRGSVPVSDAIPIVNDKRQVPGGELDDGVNLVLGWADQMGWAGTYDNLQLGVESRADTIKAGGSVYLGVRQRWHTAMVAVNQVNLNYPAVYTFQWDERGHIRRGATASLHLDCPGSSASSGLWQNTLLRTGHSQVMARYECRSDETFYYRLLTASQDGRSITLSPRRRAGPTGGAKHVPAGGIPPSAVNGRAVWYSTNTGAAYAWDANVVSDGSVQRMRPGEDASSSRQQFVFRNMFAKVYVPSSYTKQGESYRKEPYVSQGPLPYQEVHAEAVGVACNAVLFLGARTGGLAHVLPIQTARPGTCDYNVWPDAGDQVVGVALEDLSATSPGCAHHVTALTEGWADVFTGQQPWSTKLYNQEGKEVQRVQDAAYQLRCISPTTCKFTLVAAL